MTVLNLIPLYEKRYLHIEAVAFLLGTSRRGAQQAIYKARNGLYKRRPARVRKENLERFIAALSFVDDELIAKELHEAEDQEVETQS